MTLLINGKYPYSQLTENSNANPAPGTVWISNPRTSTDPTWEIISITMKRPVIISSISFSLLNIDQNYAVYVTGSNGVRSLLLDNDINPVQGSLRTSIVPSSSAWQQVATDVISTSITKIEVATQRIRQNVASTMISLGIRDILLKRTVYSAQDALYTMEDSTDIAGNVVRKQIKNWDSTNAIDNDAYTIWKSGPQPSPDSVVNFYTTVFDGSSSQYMSKRIDKVWIDPVYNGSMMNIYYSNDDYVGVLYPQAKKGWSTLAYTTINRDDGIDLTQSGSSYTLNSSGLFYAGSNGITGSASPIPATGWIGASFDIALGLTGTVNLYQSSSASYSPPAYPIKLSLNTSTGVFTFNSGDGLSSTVSSTAITSFVGRVNTVCSISQNPSNVAQYDLRLIVSVSGITVSDTTATYSWPAGSKGFQKLYWPSTDLNFVGVLGHLRGLIIKVQPDPDSFYTSFLSSPQNFLHTTPDDYPTSRQGRVAGRPIDNSVYIAEFTSGEDGFGGVGEEFYTDKVWTPIWKDWKVQRGFYYLPGPIQAKHLKLEFFNLTPQPYAIYAEGISRTYQVFPSEAAQTTPIDNGNNISSAPVKGALLRRQFWPTSPTLGQSSSQQLSRDSLPTTRIFIGSSVISNIRNMNLYNSSSIVNESAVSSSLRGAQSNSARDLTSSTLKLYSDNSSTINERMSPAPNNSQINQALSLFASNSITDASTSSSLGVKVAGWWVLPGGHLKMSASVMEAMTATSTSVTPGNDYRFRFPTASVHRYDTKISVVDVGVAYMAGLRDFQVYTTDYTALSDDPTYTLTNLSNSVASSNNITIGDQTNPTRPTSPTFSGTNPSVLLNTWPSVAPFVRVSMTTQDAGIRSFLQNNPTPLQPYGLAANGSAFWSSDSVFWGDTVNVWGSASAYVGIQLNSNMSFDGKIANAVARSNGSGSAGASTGPISMGSCRVRLCVQMFRPTASTNTITLQLEDTTPITGTILASFPINPPTGVWYSFKTPYITINNGVQNVTNNFRINIVNTGTQAETLYVADLYDEQMTTIYSISNDSGNTWYEATEIIDRDNSYLVFPTPGSGLTVKFTMLDAAQYVYGLTVTPEYLF